MSQENVAVARAAYDAWNRGDLRSVLDRLHPDVEWEENPDVYPGLDRIYRGHDGFLKRQRDAFDVWEWFRVEEQEFIDAGDQVVVLQHERRKGRGSGIEVENDTATVLTLREGKVVHCIGYMDQAEALKAVGMRDEQPGRGTT